MVRAGEPPPRHSRHGLSPALSRRSLRRIAAVARHNRLLPPRDPGQLVPVLRPVFQRAAAGGSAKMITGMMVLYSMLALSIVGTTTLAERARHTWDRLRARRTRGYELLLGKTLPAYAVLLLQ
ncbi:hypothetical protein [Dactylosporangium sp. CA-139066]|uniref:hypothetical protein n=1 Tax=Dactylosporangium sp. CA-139066 TaxID=3239930 RepID=UPI003D8BEE4E